MRVNSLEQLLINFANETLQAQFNAHTFTRELELYASEGIAGERDAAIEFNDNSPVLRLIAAKTPAGLLPLLEEHGLLSRAPDDRALCAAYHKAHAPPPTVRSPRASDPPPPGGVALAAAAKPPPPPPYAVPRFASEDHFVVRHYAGDVTYAVHGFLAKVGQITPF
jgi:myosin-5